MAQSDHVSAKAIQQVVEAATTTRLLQKAVKGTAEGEGERAGLLKVTAAPHCVSTA